MKYLNKTAVLLSFLALGLLSACDQDQMGEEYTTGAGITFNCSSLPSVAVPANDPTFTVDVYRSNTQGTLTGSVSIEALQGDKNKTPLSGCTVSDYAFADGESKTTVTVNVEPLPVAVELTVTLTLSDENSIAVGGTAKTKVIVNKDYSWVLLGTGTYTDNFAIEVTYNVEVYRAEGFDRWRVKEPYTEGIVNDDGGNGNWCDPNNVPNYVTFWNAGDLVRFDPFSIGLNYQGDKTCPIYAYPAYYFNGIKEGYSKWVDSKTVQLAPYYYIDGVGGWDYTQYDGVVVITLP